MPFTDKAIQTRLEIMCSMQKEYESMSINIMLLTILDLKFMWLITETACCAPMCVLSSMHAHKSVF